MNAVEIEQALSELAAQPFDAAEFPFQFLAAFGNKDTTLQRLRKGDSNASDVPGAVLQRNHIHLVVAEPGQVGNTLTALKASAKTAQAKAKFILATDGTTLEAEELATGDAIACDFAQFPDHFGFFLPLAGISTIKEIKDNPIDVRATGRLNKLYVELLRENPDWAKAARRPDMNHFMARLIFCFFAEDTDIFPGASLFTATVERMSERDGSNVHEILSTIFRAMNLKTNERSAAGLPRWAAEFPYVNGGLFSGSTDVPKFTRTARSYLYQAGQLDWREINPDIFGSMIQAVADDEERGALGMHYTSVPNILKVLNPLFLDDLRTQLEAAGDNKIKLLNLRKRMARIRVFDPACGSGNFLVIAYKQMRQIEAEINQRRDEYGAPSEIPINNFRGIELRDFPAEIARLALIIAEFQCDVLYRGQKEALKDVLPLDSQNWITCGNALRLDWLAICPPTGTGVRLVSDDLFNAPINQSEIDFENEGGETYICGNPPYLGSRGQDSGQKSDLFSASADCIEGYRSLDFVAGWFVKAGKYVAQVRADFAFVATNSICQGQQVDVLWPWLLGQDLRIKFAWTSFKWKNLASHNAGVTVVIIGMTSRPGSATIYESAGDTVIERDVENINPYLVPGRNVFVAAQSARPDGNWVMDRGSAPTDDGAYLFVPEEKRQVLAKEPRLSAAFFRAVGANEFSKGLVRWALKPDELPSSVQSNSSIVSERVLRVRASRMASTKTATRSAAGTPERYTEDRFSGGRVIFIPQLVSEKREYYTPGLLPERSLVLAPHFQLGADCLVPFSLLASRLHFIWVATVCGKLKTDYRYSSKLGWNTFPVPQLTELNKAEMTECAKGILLAREAHFPATIAELYEVKDGECKMPNDLLLAHERNDEVLERIYIGRRFKNDTERLEKLFELYTKMTASQPAPKKRKTK